MRITYIKLKNVAGLLVGSNKNELEINFSNSKNNIISILGENGVGKSTLLASLNPFPSIPSIDERSSISFFVKGKEGYKEIHYLHDDNKYIVKIYAKPNKDSHTLKCYISVNDEELNKNGNVRSFYTLVETYLGLTEEMLRLIMLGSNLSSIISLTPAKRKEYIGKLIEEIDAYLIIYKNINDDIRLCKQMMNVNSSNLYKYHIQDLTVEEEKLNKLLKDIRSYEKDRDKLIGKISKINALMKDNDIHDLRRKKQEAESSIADFNKIKNDIDKQSLSLVTLDQLMKKRSDLSEEKLNIQSKINSYRISIDSSLKNIERLEVSIKRITSDNDIQSLTDIIASLKEKINVSSQLIKGFNPTGIVSEDLQSLISSLISFNQISKTIYSFGHKPIEIYLNVLTRKDTSIDRFLKDQAKKSLNRIDENNLKLLFDKVFEGNDIITPNCDDEYKHCPYYRLSEIMFDVKEKLEEESYDDETLRYIQIISNNIDMLFNNLDKLRLLKLPDTLLSLLTEKSVLDRMKSYIPFFDLSSFYEYLAILKEYEIYVSNITRLKEYEHQLSVYKKSGIDNHIKEIEELNKNIAFYKNNIEVLNGDIISINNKLSVTDDEISLVTRYHNGKKYIKLMESTLSSTEKLLIPLENASNEKMELEFSLREITNVIDSLRLQHKELESKINEYKKLVEEGEKLSIKFKHLSMIAKSTSTKEGMPVKHIKKYLGKIRNLANTLLNIIYDGEFQLGKFHIDQDTFEIPYVKNGKTISDIKYASKSELSLSTMALSFALANEASQMYNILYLDEIDSGLDENNRTKFLKMLYTQIKALHADQVFIISHNMSQMINIPMDCIILSENIKPRKFQNVIYDINNKEED